MTTIQIHGLDDDWNATDEGDASIYTTPPELVPASHAARVIYELRLDVERLNNEVLAACQDSLAVDAAIAILKGEP